MSALFGLALGLLACRHLALVELSGARLLRICDITPEGRQQQFGLFDPARLRELQLRGGAVAVLLEELVESRGEPGRHRIGSQRFQQLLGRCRGNDRRRGRIVRRAVGQLPEFEVALGGEHTGYALEQAQRQLPIADPGLREPEQHLDLTEGRGLALHQVLDELGRKLAGRDDGEQQLTIAALVEVERTQRIAFGERPRPLGLPAVAKRSLLAHAAQEERQVGEHAAVVDPLADGLARLGPAHRQQEMAREQAESLGDQLEHQADVEVDVAVVQRDEAATFGQVLPRRVEAVVERVAHQRPGQRRHHDGQHLAGVGARPLVAIVLLDLDVPPGQGQVERLERLEVDILMFSAPAQLAGLAEVVFERDHAIANLLDHMLVVLAQVFDGPPPRHEQMVLQVESRRAWPTSGPHRDPRRTLNHARCS